MTTRRHTQVFQQLRQVVLAHDGAGLTDAELMTHFVGQRDGAALEALIRRHGSMVWSVCRRILGNEQDAEDAFQASFLVFVRKATSIRPREQVGNWLYGVAYRTALKARTKDARRRAKERRAAAMTPTQTETDVSWSELLPLLDQELARLPDKYRAAIVLCELEGRPRKEAARQLGIPEGTLSSRLATGRRMLAKRLGRPGLGLSAGALATTSVVVPPTLMASTVKAVTLVAAGQATIAGVVSVRVAALAEGVVKAMLLTKLSAGAAILAVVAVLAAGAGGAAYCAAAADPKPPKAPPVVAVSPKGNNVDKEEVKKEESAWGEAVDGVQARLRTSKIAWNDGQTPEFALDLRNRGRRTPSGCRSVQFCELELDGKWYEYRTDGVDCKSSMLPPGKQVDFWGSVSLAVPWTRKTPARKPGDKGEPLQISAGKHTVRVAFVFEPSALPPGFGVPADPGMRPISNPVEIEVGRESAWGEAVDGVQARLRTPRGVWKEGEAPTFILDLRNVGKGTPHQRHVPFDCEIKVDGKWYGYTGAVGYVSKNTALEPGQEYDDWVKVTPDPSWQEKPGGVVNGSRPLVPLPPGKHTIRITYPFNGEKPPFRPVSGPVEIEVGKESAWGAAVDGVQARLRPARTSWDAGKAPEFSLDLRNQGKHGFSLGRLPQFCEIELDGKWYDYAGRIARDRVSSAIQPGEEVDDCVAVSLDGPWVLKRTGRKWDEPIGDKDERMQVPAGKHTVRVAFSSDTAPSPLRPISQPVAIEVAKESAWGEAVDGVQARIRTPKVIWKAGEAPTFLLDLRNQGKRTPHAMRIPLVCEIEVDGTWCHYRGLYAIKSEDTPLESGKEIDNWVEVTQIDHWVWKPLEPGTDPFPLAPGKHTFRILFPFPDGTPPIRPISGPIEIEVGKEPVPGKPVDGVLAPAKQAAPSDAAGPDDKQTAARRAVVIREKLSEPINYELPIDTTLDNALVELLTRNKISWKVNTPAFVKQGDDPNVVSKTQIAKIDKLEGVSRRMIMEHLISNIESKSGDGKAVGVIRPYGVEITTRRAYLDEFFPGRKDLNLPPLVYAVFDKVPLPEALAELGHTTGSNVVLAGRLGQAGETKITADLTGVPLDTAVVILANMADLKLVRLDNVYYVTSRERARLLEAEEQERLLKEEKGKADPAKPQAAKAEPKK
jgi:RNA polymerase sigma factor (sigma-70 family)